MRSAREWKAFYAREREALGPAGLEALVRGAHLDLARHSALVFPHTRLTVSGAQTAAVARALVRSGRETVLALGVLHGARESDRERVAAARAGDATSREALRGVHASDGLASEEFSLDALAALLPIAARVEGRPAPRLVQRYPFLVGETVADLPGLGELERLVAEGAALVATGDLIHHGAGYGTPLAEQRAREDPRTVEWARACVVEGLALLAAPTAFLARCVQDRSDFRDVGPVMAHLLGGVTSCELRDLVLVDYADVLRADEPTWVAAALLEVGP